MEKENDPVFVDPSAVTPRQLRQDEMGMLVGGGAITIVIKITIALVY